MASSVCGGGEWWMGRGEESCCQSDDLESVCVAIGCWTMARPDKGDAERGYEMRRYLLQHLQPHGPSKQGHWPGNKGHSGAGVPKIAKKYVEVLLKTENVMNRFWSCLQQSRLQISTFYGLFPRCRVLLFAIVGSKSEELCRIELLWRKGGLDLNPASKERFGLAVALASQNSMLTCVPFVLAGICCGWEERCRDTTGRVRKTVRKSSGNRWARLFPSECELPQRIQKEIKIKNKLKKLPMNSDKENPMYKV